MSIIINKLNFKLYLSSFILASHLHFNFYSAIITVIQIQYIFWCTFCRKSKTEKQILPARWLFNSWISPCCTATILSSFVSLSSLRLAAVRQQNVVSTKNINMLLQMCQMNWHMFSVRHNLYISVERKFIGFFLTFTILPNCLANFAALADLMVCQGRAPLGIQILSFLCSFREKKIVK